MTTRRAVLAAAPVVALAGCATIESWFQNPAIVAGIQDAINIAVGLVFSNLGAGSLQIANEVLAVIAQLIGLASKDSTTVATLGTDAINLVNSTSLNAPIKEALVNVVGFAAGILATQVNAIPAQASGNLVTVFTDIQHALQLYVNGAKSQAGKAATSRMGLHLGA